MNESDDEAQSLTASYRAFSIVVGIGLVAALTYAGYAGLPPIPTILVGAVAQTIFRVSKRSWKRSLTNLETNDPGASPKTTEDRKALILVFVAMIAVSALWYGVGWFFR